MSSRGGARALADLPALEGGVPVRERFLPFSRIEVGAEEEQALIAALRSGWIGTGPLTQRFEAAFAPLAGTRTAVGVASCTAGLHLALRASGVGPGHEVVTSPVSFPATANAIIHAGATPVLADVLPESLTLDPSAVAAALTPRTHAILAVHLAGWPSEMDPLATIARRAGVALIEDAAHALGATYRGRPVGSLGDAAAFSFYATKNITTAEGGMVTTDHEDWASRIRVERLHGLDLDASQRAGPEYRHYEAVSIGWKYNLSDLCAALGLAQLEKLPRFLSRRRELDRRYRRALADHVMLAALVGPAGAETAAHLFPVLIRPGALRVGRDRVLSALLAENVGVGVHFRALPLHRFFREEIGLRPEQVPVATEASERMLSLPLYPGLSDRDQDEVVEALERILRFYAA